jgi:hypothetical protein
MKPTTSTISRTQRIKGKTYKIQEVVCDECKEIIATTDLGVCGSFAFQPQHVCNFLRGLTKEKAAAIRLLYPRHPFLVMDGDGEAYLFSKKPQLIKNPHYPFAGLWIHLNTTDTIRLESLDNYSSKSRESFVNLKTFLKNP